MNRTASSAGAYHRSHGHLIETQTGSAARKYRGQPAGELKWGTKIEAEGVMDLVTVNDAIAAFERYRSDIG